MFMSILYDKNVPKRLDKKETFEVPFSVVFLGSLVFGSGIFALMVFFCRECFL